MKNSHISDGTTVDGKEGKDETENTGKDGQASVHVELELGNQAGDDQEDDGTSGPDPGGNLVLSGSKVLDQAIVLVGFGSLLLNEGDLLTASLELGVDGTARLAESVLGAVPDNLDVDEELDETVDDEDHDTGPEEPVSGRGDVAGGVDTRHGAETGQTSPLALFDHNTNALSVVNEERTGKTPGEDGAEPPREGGVETDEDTGAEEGGSQLDVPTPRVNGQHGGGLVARPSKEPDEDLPVVENTVGVLANNDEEKSADEGVSESLDLTQGISGTRSNGVHGTDSHGGGGGRREDKVELASDIDDEELAKRHGGEKAKEGTDKGDCQDTSEVLLGVIGEQVETVHGGEAGDEDTGETTGAGGGGLDDGVLLGTELLADEGDAGETLCQEEDETVAEDGTEHGGGKGETSLET